MGLRQRHLRSAHSGQRTLFARTRFGFRIFSQSQTVLFLGSIPRELREQTVVDILLVVVKIVGLLWVPICVNKWRSERRVKATPTSTVDRRKAADFDHYNFLERMSMPKKTSATGERPQAQG